jgi:hypothetical protein
MRSARWLILVAYLLRLIAGAGMVECVHADGLSRLEWIGATCCAGECLGAPRSSGAALTSSGCDCEDHALTPPAAVQARVVPAEAPPGLIAIAPDLASFALPAIRPGAGPGCFALVIDPGRPRAIASTVLRC